MGEIFKRPGTYRTALIWSILALLLLRIVAGPGTWPAFVVGGWVLLMLVLDGVLTLSVAEIIWGKDPKHGLIEGWLHKWPHNWPFVVAFLAVPFLYTIPPLRRSPVLVPLALWGIIFWRWSRAEDDADIIPEAGDDESIWARISRHLDAGLENPLTGVGVAGLLILLALRINVLPDVWSVYALTLFLVFGLLFLRSVRRTQKQVDEISKRRKTLGLSPVASDPPWWLALCFFAAVASTVAVQARVWLVVAFALAAVSLGAYVLFQAMAIDHTTAEVAKAEGEAAEQEREKERVKKCDELLTRYARVFLPVRRAKLQKLVAEGMAPDELEELILALLDEPEAGVSLGEKAPSRFEPLPPVPETVFADPETRFRHTYVLGKTGSGKTNFLLTLILQDIRAGRGLAALSPDTDLLTGILGQLPRDRATDVIYFDPSDEDRPVCFNPVELSAGEDIDIRVDENVAAFKRVFGAPGQRMEEILSHTFCALLERPGSTLLDIEPLLEPRDPRLRREIAATTKNPQTARFFTEVYPRLPKDAHLPVVTRISRLVRSRVLRTVLCSPTTIDFRAVMDDGRIALFNFSEALGEGVSSLLGQLVISKFQVALLGRSTVRPDARPPFFLYVDEFQTFAGQAIETYQKLLARARKYQLGLVLAHQHTGQLSLELLKDILGNVGTKVCFAMGFDDAARLARELQVEPKDLTNLPIGSAYCKVQNTVYRMQVPVVRPPRDAKERAQEVLERSRAGIQTSQAPPVREPAPLPPPAPAAPKPPPAPRGPDSRRKADDEPPQKPIAAQRASVEPPRPLPAAPAAPPAQGRGKQEHTYLQELIGRWAQSKNYLTAIEKQILDGLGSVDVALQKSGVSIACEISVGSSPEQELSNVRKCLAGGFDAVAVVATDKKHLAKVKDFAGANLSETELSRVQYLTPEDLFSFLEELETSAMSEEKTETVRGYKVSRRVSRLSPAEKDARKKAIAKVIVAATKRMREKSA